jgi:adenylate cyclase
MLGVPLILNERIVGVLGVLNPQNRVTFTPNDRQLLSAIGSQMDTAIFERLQTQRLREVFGRNVGTKVMNRLLQISDRDLLEGERVELSVLFSDIRGFTRASADIDPHVLEDVIDEHFGAMIEVVLRNEGTLDKFLGDGVMAFFNAPERQPQHPVKAVETAIEMQKTHQKVMKNWAARGLEDMPIGIGIATGEVIVGNFGSVAHAEYSAIGSTVNLAARLCEEAEGGQILVNQNTRDLANHVYSMKELPPKNLQGFRNPRPVWQVNMESER